MFGGPRNVLPSGVLSANPGGTTVNRPVTLTAGFKDPDSKITGYDWDLDGNGSIDRSTAEPTTTTTYDRPGTFSPKVFAKDFRGGSGSASTGVLITPGAPPPGAASPPASKRPTLVLPRSGTKGRARFLVTCDSACLGNANVIISRATARKLELNRRTVATKQFLFSRARTDSVTIKISKSVLRKMRKANMRVLEVRLRVSVTDLEGQTLSASRTLRLRRN